MNTLTPKFPDLVVICCGGAKRPTPAPAGDLYTGSYFRQCQRTARALRPVHGYLILSALHGLTEPTTVIAPYDLRMGQPGSVQPALLAEQAKTLGVDVLTDVVVLAGRAYADAARTVWPAARCPLLGGRGIGDQKAMLSRIETRGALL